MTEINFRDDEKWAEWVDAYLESGKILDACKKVPEIDYKTVINLRHRNDGFNVWLKEQEDDYIERALKSLTLRVATATMGGKKLTPDEIRNARVLLSIFKGKSAPTGTPDDRPADLTRMEVDELFDWKILGGVEN